jgi:taurine dioxygenase
MRIRVTPFEAGLGAEIVGVDIREPLAPAERDRIRAAWLDHLVLRFRDSPMEEIAVISNIIENGKAIGGLGDGEAFWHTDGSFVDVPPAASLLRALDVPPPSAGGATEFLNMYSAYETMVRTHPETGRKALFLGRRINAYVVGLPVEDSEALLDFLWEHTVQQKFTWRQEWRVGDLICWDNRCAMHRRDAFDPAMRRLMHRTQLKGTRPV